MVIKAFLNKIKSLDYYFIITIIVAAYLRLWNLGYSDYQGDEIRALFIPIQGESFSGFLLRQRKGPLQFIISYLIKFIDPTYTNYFIDRLPFALAAVLSIVFFYLFVKNIFNKRTAFFATFLMSVNGFFVALSRILQYQGLVFLFTSIALYLYSLGSKEKGKKGVLFIFLGTVSWGFSMLAHYDGIFIAPILFYFGILWLKNSDIKLSVKLIYASLSVIVALLMQLSFYLPLFFSLTSETKSYWTGRITGSLSAKSASSLNLFNVYQPLFASYAYLIMLFISAIVLGIVVLQIIARYSLFKKINQWKVFKFIYKHTPNYLADSPVTYVFLFFWMAMPILFMEKIVTIPGTHIYTYIEPLVIILGFGLDYLLGLVKLNRFFVNTLFLIIIVLFIFLSYQSFQLFVDNDQDYPWGPIKILTWTVQPPNHDIYNLSIFGFPYNRSWRSVTEFVKHYPNIKDYSSNENNAITNYYTRLEKDTNKAGFYIFVRDPQTFKADPNNKKYLYWASKNDPVFSVSRNGEAIVNVYIMQPGTFEQLSGSKQ